MELHRRMHELSDAPAGAANAAGVASVELDAARGSRASSSNSRRSRHFGIHAATIGAAGALVDAHLAETITLDRLCALSGVGGRVLQKSLMALRGQSPLEWSRRVVWPPPGRGC